MNKVIIFTASTGGGHNIAANSIREHFAESGYEAETMDAFKETSRFLDRIIAKGYERIVHISPKTFGRMYRAANNETLSHYIMWVITDVMEDDIQKILEEKKPDLLVVTHPLVTNVLATLKKDGLFHIPIVSIVTDYRIHQAYIHEEVDAYIVGSEYTKQTMIERGVEPHRIHPFGIPVRKSFLDHKKVVVKDYDVDLTVLLMAGSMGTNQIEKAFISLLQSNHYLKIVAVCGNNEKVKGKIEKIAAEYDGNKIVTILGFAENIPELMDMADVVITKPGGLTTTEAIIKNIPMIIPYYIPGQEEENADFLVETGMAIKVEKITDLSEVVGYLVHNKDILDTMAFNMSELARARSIDQIIELGNDLIQTYEKNEADS
ncbi:galactosyldiacylglycerol synthase [Alkalibacter rhizosphaerae]|uniref:Galactosyldiacylglycerol synthase n=1 Tax=Alkalibacter rhizosphaerae TaxID=2815577 RepID=A0A974XM57_9FIRM|nr:glycosyltransferase [Alkalibacter rhizosphaerae]QSX08476.1 galactosyldiacylglycerol synthase [Alkalibacter rhizosphaerae]